MTQPTLLNFITCHFGVKGSWMAGYHTGIDYRATVGTRLFATKGGKIVHAGEGGSYGSAYGKYIVLQTSDKGRGVQVLYAHLSKPTVKVGQKVKAGDFIGYSGDTGNTFGAHLHYEERYSPYSYWNHRKPVFPDWKPVNAKWLDVILKKIGVRKK